MDLAGPVALMKPETGSREDEGKQTQLMKSWCYSWRQFWARGASCCPPAFLSAHAFTVPHCMSWNTDIRAQEHVHILGSHMPSYCWHRSIYFWNGSFLDFLIGNKKLAFNHDRWKEGSQTYHWWLSAHVGFRLTASSPTFFPKREEETDDIMIPKHESKQRKKGRSTWRIVYWDNTTGET